MPPSKHLPNTGMNAQVLPLSVIFQGSPARNFINILNLIMSIIVFSTGWILFTQFHIGDGAFRQEWMGIAKVVWTAIHQSSAIGFFIGLLLHIRMHWQYIKTMAKRWGKEISKKVKSRIRWQILLSVGTIVVVWAGFYPLESSIKQF